jgi:hypothetical protein
MFSMLTELQETLSKGGSQGLMENQENVVLEEEKPAEEFEEKKEDEASKQEEETKEEEKNPEGENADEKKKNYNLDEIPEYVELTAQFAELQGNFSALEQEKNDLTAEVESLREFKLSAERKEKQNMIDSFYMLTDEDKKDVVEHIDTYSLEDIEGKLSIICVRNKVNFNLNEEQENQNDPKVMFSLNGDEGSENVPEWLRAVQETKKSLH